MRALFRRAVADARRFRSDSKAAAIVEFALVVPVLLVLYMGTIEVSDLIAVDRRVNVISGTMGDLVARADTCILGSTVTDYFKASEGIIVPYSKTGLKQVVALLSVHATTGVATVSWSQAYNGGTAKTVNSTYPLPAAMVDISKGKSVVMSETSYAYKPLLGWVVKSAINLHRISYYIPRESTTITYQASGSCA
jgi:Flp pilus assembly protein TadG